MFNVDISLAFKKNQEPIYSDCSILLETMSKGIIKASIRKMVTCRLWTCCMRTVQYDIGIKQSIIRLIDPLCLEVDELLVNFSGNSNSFLERASLFV